jgi:hypothetical protein
VSQDSKSILDDIIETGREALQKLDEFLNPEKKRKLARVPVPIRSNPPRSQKQNPYDQSY